jgi:large subunit ribosomal protein L18
MASKIIRKQRSSAKINTDTHVVVVSRSNQNILAQVLEPKTLRPVFTANSYKLTGVKTEQATKVGDAVGQYLSKNSIDKISFNRSGYLYHGRIKAVAEAIRANKINF